jgi:hypothetical protein
MQRLGKHVPGATVEVLLETVISTRSVPWSYKEGNWNNQVSSVRESEKGGQLERSRLSERT